MTFLRLALAATLLTACSSATVLAPTQTDDDPTTTTIEGAPQPSEPHTSDKGADGATNDPSRAVPNNDAPEISRSRGKKGGVVVLWPRIVGKSKADVGAHDLAVSVQGRLRALAADAGASEIELRPEPERVCPKGEGCDATAVSALVVKNGDSCAVLAVVSKPGKSPQTIVPWLGKARLKSPTAEFREPPESQVTLDDFAACAKAVDGLVTREKDVVAAIKAAM